MRPCRHLGTLPIQYAVMKVLPPPGRDHASSQNITIMSITSHIPFVLLKYSRNHSSNLLRKGDELAGLPLSNAFDQSLVLCIGPHPLSLSLRERESAPAMRAVRTFSVCRGVVGGSRTAPTACRPSEARGEGGDSRFARRPSPFIPLPQGEGKCARDAGGGWRVSAQPLSRC